MCVCVGGCECVRVRMRECGCECVRVRECGCDYVWVDVRVCVSVCA